MLFYKIHDTATLQLTMILPNAGVLSLLFFTSCRQESVIGRNLLLLVRLELLVKILVRQRLTVVSGFIEDYLNSLFVKIRR